jgi:hypothetical protein
MEPTRVARARNARRSELAPERSRSHPFHESCSAPVLDVLTLNCALILKGNAARRFERQPCIKVSSPSTSSGAARPSGVVFTRTASTVYAELVAHLGFTRPKEQRRLSGAAAPPQIVIGHRIWREADTSNTERFVGLTEVEIIKPPRRAAKAFSFTSVRCTAAGRSYSTAS